MQLNKTTWKCSSSIVELFLNDFCEPVQRRLLLNSDSHVSNNKPKYVCEIFTTGSITYNTIND